MNAQTEINDAVEAAIRENMSPLQFIAVARELWAAQLEEQAKFDNEQFLRALETRTQKEPRNG